MAGRTVRAASRSASEACAREDGLGLLQRLDLLIASRLPDLEVVEGEIAGRVESPVHAPKIQKILDRRTLVALVLGLLDLVLAFLLLILHQGLLLRLDRGV